MNFTTLLVALVLTSPFDDPAASSVPGEPIPGGTAPAWAPAASGTAGQGWAGARDETPESVAPGELSRPDSPVDMRDLATGPETGRAGSTSGTSAELLARALASPTGAELDGRPTGLLAALASVQDPGQQLSVVHAYWDAVAMVGQYHLRQRARQMLEVIEPRPGDEAMLRTARASSAAAVDEAHVAAVAAQHALAQHGSMSSTVVSLPLPSDRPCVGPYETRFDQIFANRPAPAQAWLMERTLPLRRQAMERRAKALAAAEGALDDSRRAYGSGSVTFERVLAAAAAWVQQEDAFMRSVRDYNHDIATYVASARIGPTDGATLVSMLIGPRLEPQPESLVPVGGTTSIGSPTPAGRSPWHRPAPTLAPPEGSVRAAGHAEPLPGASRPRVEPMQGRGRSGPPIDLTPNLFPVEGKLVPVEAASGRRPVAASPVGEQPEAPKIPVIPVE